MRPVHGSTDPGTADTQSYAWSVTKDGSAYASASGPAFAFTPDDNGTYAVTLTATDDDGGIGTDAKTITVNNVAPTLTLSGAAAVNEAATYTLNLSASDPGADAISAWSINWGDGTTQAVSGNPPSVTHTYADGPAMYTISAAATDEDGTYAAGNTVTVTVNNLNPTATFANDGDVDEGAPARFHFTGVTDPSSVDTAAGLRFDTDETLAHLTTDYTSGAVSSSPDSNYFFGDSGTYTVYGRVLDKDGGYSTYQSTVTVRNVAPTATLSNDGPVPEGSPANVRFTDAFDPAVQDRDSGFHYSFATDPADLPTTYAAAGTAASRPFTFPDNGTYTVWGRIFDKDSGYRDYTTQVVVQNVAPTPTLAGAPASSPEGTAISLTGSYANPGSADTVTLAWSVTKSGNAYAAGTGASFSFTPDDNGSYVVTLTATDDDGGVGTDTKTIAVTNVAPTLTLAGAAAVNEGSAYTLNLSSSDPGADTISSWAVTWGDGTTQTVTGNPSSVTHTYADNGAYTISASAADEDGTYAAGNTVAVTVNNVAPTLTLSGAAAVNEAATYTLNLSAERPGDRRHQLTGASTGATGRPRPSAGNPSSVAHTYADGPNGYTIARDRRRTRTGPTPAGNTVTVHGQQRRPDPARCPGPSRGKRGRHGQPVGTSPTREAPTLSRKPGACRPATGRWSPAEPGAATRSFPPTTGPTPSPTPSETMTAG